jgi:hypothetical protein
MCIMEVRPEQHHATIAQAMAHNTSTIDRDLEMFVEVLRARSHHDPEVIAALDSVLSAQSQVHRAYAQLLTVFGEMVAAGVATTEGHVHEHDHGNERSFVEAVQAATRRARRFETR